jgi:hypothetical protein
MKICSANTQERILELIKQYYYSENIVIENNIVRNTKLDKTLGKVICKKNRYIFETN